MHNQLRNKIQKRLPNHHPEYLGRYYVSKRDKLSPKLIYVVLGSTTDRIIKIRADEPRKNPCVIVSHTEFEWFKEKFEEVFPDDE